MSTVPEPIAAFIDAVNRHDEDAVLNAFTDLGAVDDWGRVFSGRAAIKGWSDKEFMGARGTIVVESVSTDGGKITVVGDWRSTYANGLSKFIFDVDGDRISRMTIREG